MIPIEINHDLDLLRYKSHFLIQKISTLLFAHFLNFLFIVKRSLNRILIFLIFYDYDYVL